MRLFGAGFNAIPAALVTFLLLLLMVQLAGLNKLTQRVVEPPQEMSLSISEDEFQPAPQSEPLLPEPVVEPLPEMPLQAEPQLMPPELDMPELQELELEPEIMPLDLPLNTSVLEEVTVKVAKKVAKKVVKPRPKPQKVVKPVVKAITKPAVQPSAQPVITKASAASARAVRSSAASTPLYRVNPNYPKRAKRRGIEGEVLVEFTVQPNGKVKPGSIAVVRAVPKNVFEKVVVRALSKWRFAASDRAYKTSKKLVFKLNK